MVRSSIAALCVLALSFCPVAAQQPATPPAATRTLSTDLRIAAILKVTLSSKKSKIGDPVNLEVAADVRDPSGAVVIPRHAKLAGHVIQVAHYEKNKQAAILSFVVDHAAWKDGSAELDAPVYGVDILASSLRQGESVGELRAATLGISDPVDIVNTEVMSDTRSGSVGSGYAHAVRDAAFHTVVMQLHRVPDPAIRSTFMKRDGDLHIPSEFLVVLRNGMQAMK